AIAKTVGKDQAQQVYRASYYASLQKSAGVPRALLKGLRAPKPLYDIFPVPIQERFVSHPTLNHKSIPTSKNILTPMRFRGDKLCTPYGACSRSSPGHCVGCAHAATSSRCDPARGIAA